MELLVLFGVLFALLVIGVPVAFSLLAAALACFLAMDIPPIVAVQRVAAGISVFTLMAIPFFIFAGDLMYRAGIAERLVRVADAAIGRVRGEARHPHKTLEGAPSTIATRGSACGNDFHCLKIGGGCARVAAEKRLPWG